jgi:hypothetical protein
MLFKELISRFVDEMAQNALFAASGCEKSAFQVDFSGF